MAKAFLDRGLSRRRRPDRHRAHAAVQRQALRPGPACTRTERSVHPNPRISDGFEQKIASGGARDQTLTLVRVGARCRLVGLARCVPLAGRWISALLVALWSALVVSLSALALSDLPLRRVCVSSSAGSFPQLNTHRHAHGHQERIEREVLECPVPRRPSFTEDSITTHAMFPVHTMAKVCHALRCSTHRRHVVVVQDRNLSLSVRDCLPAGADCGSLPRTRATGSTGYRARPHGQRSPPGEGQRRRSRARLQEPPSGQQRPTNTVATVG